MGYFFGKNNEEINDNNNDNETIKTITTYKLNGETKKKRYVNIKNKTIKISCFLFTNKICCKF